MQNNPLQFSRSKQSKLLKPLLGSIYHPLQQKEGLVQISAAKIYPGDIFKFEHIHTFSGILTLGFYRELRGKPESLAVEYTYMSFLTLCLGYQLSARCHNVGKKEEKALSLLFRIHLTFRNCMY